jgi:integrase
LARSEAIEQGHARKQRLDERGLSAGSINKCLKVLAQILDDAVEDGYLTENPARGKRRMLKTSKPRRTWLELHEAKALIEAATPHRALIATMVLSGLRVGELTQLRWRDVNLASGTLKVEDAKTAAGQRVIDLTPWLQEELATHKAGARFVDPGDFVFSTRNRTALQRSNISRQILRRSIDDASAALVEAGGAPIQSHVTNHSLRRTFASVLYEAGASPAYVMAQMGHESSTLALEVYARVMDRKRETGARMDELVRGPVFDSPIGTSAETPAMVFSSRATKKPRKRLVR